MNDETYLKVIELLSSPDKDTGTLGLLLIHGQELDVVKIVDILFDKNNIKNITINMFNEYRTSTYFGGCFKILNFITVKYKTSFLSSKCWCINYILSHNNSTGLSITTTKYSDSKERYTRDKSYDGFIKFRNRIIKIYNTGIVSIKKELVSLINEEILKIIC